MANDMAQLAGGVEARSPFDALRREDERGEYWSARDLMAPLGYARWDGFEDAIERAVASAKNAGENDTSHFSKIRGATNLQQTRQIAPVPFSDYRLSRYAAYLVAMNGDPRKPEIAAAQQYFAAKTREAEQAEELTEVEKLLVVVTNLARQEREAKLLAKQQAETRALVVNHADRLRTAEARLDSVEHNTGLSTVLAYARRERLPLTNPVAVRLGKAATALYRARTGQEPPQGRDDRYGYVNLYPDELLGEVFCQEL